MVQLGKLVFSVYAKEHKGTKDLVEINSIDGIYSSSLYSGSEQCDKCHPTTKYCRGHLGVIYLYQHYINHMYRDRVDSLFKITCRKCFKPSSRYDEKYLHKVELVNKYVSLVRLYKGSVCKCTDSSNVDANDPDKYSTKLDSFDAIGRLRSSYKVFSNMGSNILQEVFMLDSEEIVLCNYVLVLPYDFLISINDGDKLIEAYEELLTNKSKNNEKDILSSVLNVHEKCAKMLKGKQGTIRKLGLSRKVGRSARAVIVPDPYIALESIGIPDELAKYMSSEITINEENLYFVIKSILLSRVNYIIYSKKRYTIVSSSVGIEMLVYADVNSQSVSMLSLLPGDKVGYEGTKDRLLFNLDNTCKIISMVKSEKKILVERFTDSYLVNSSRLVTLFVEVPCEDNKLTTVSIPIQFGAKISLPCNGQSILIHRNPVLSADSIHVHDMHILRNKQKLSMSNQELQAQKGKANDSINIPMLGPSFKSGQIVNNTSYDIRSNLTPGAPMFEDVYVKGDIVIYKMFRGNNLEEAKVINSPKPSVCYISMHPLATTPYNADFDGDEINAYSLEPDDKCKNISLLADTLRGTFGPIHDAQFGLYKLITNCVGLSWVRNDFVEYISNILCEQETLDTSVLINCGLSESETKLVESKIAKEFNIYSSGDYNSKGEYKSSVKTILGSNLKRIFFIGDFNSSVVNFITQIRLNQDRLKLKDNLAFNKFFVDFVKVKDNSELLRLDYFEFLKSNHSYAGKIEDRRILSMFYSDIAMILFKICDYCSVKFSRLDKKGAKLLVDSKCRPKASTYDTLFNSIGKNEYALPEGEQSSYISGNYCEGISKEEFLSLCFSNRLQLVVKGKNTAPQGNLARLMHMYTSDLNIQENKWSDRGKVFHNVITEEELRSHDETVAARPYEDYTYLILEKSPRLRYREIDHMSAELKRDRRKVMHRGQRKLLMSEIDFLTDYYKEEDLVVYAGAAPGSHIPVLVRLFPKINFKLYDNSDYSANLYDKTSYNKSIKGVDLKKKYLTKDNCKKYFGKGNILFISDIRINTNKDGKPLDIDITRDNEIVNNLINIMKPKKSLIKFRLPYMKGKSLMPVGEIRLQCWVGKESTECRLACDNEFKEYDNIEHEEKMFYHNLKRPYKVHDCYISKAMIKQPDMSQHEPYYDFNRESHIIDKYCKRFDSTDKHVYRCMHEVLGSDESYYINKQE